MDQRTISPTVRFTDGVNQDIKVDPTLYAEVYDGDRITPTFLLNLASVPPIIENPLGNGRYSYHVSNLDVSSFSGTPIIKWFASKNGVSIEEYPVIQTPPINESSSEDLAVLSTVPDDALTEADPRTKVIFTFDQELDPASVEPGTVIVYEALSHRPVRGLLRILGEKSVQFTPESELKENLAYIASVVGLEARAAAGYIKSTGGGVLRKSVTVGFRTGEDRYAKLDEVTSPGDIERTAPIRIAVPIVSAPVTSLLVVATTPTAFSTNFDPAEAIRIRFNKKLGTVDPDLVSVEFVPVLGIEDFFATAMGGKPVLWVSGGLRIKPEFGITVQDTDLLIQPQGSWLYNAEQIVTLKTGIVAEDGSALDASFQFSYTTSYFPLWSSPTVMRLELRRFVGSDAFTDDVYHRYVHKSSLELALFRSSIININAPTATVRMLAKNLTLRDLIESEILPGYAQRKSLGQFMVERGLGDVVTIQGKVKTVREEIKRLERMLLGPKLAAQGAVRGLTSPFEKPNFRIRTWQLVHDFGGIRDYSGGNEFDDRARKTSPWNT